MEHDTNFIMCRETNILYRDLFCSRRSTDRTTAFEAVYAGSIPAESTANEGQESNGKG